MKADVLAHLVKEEIVAADDDSMHIVESVVRGAVDYFNSKEGQKKFIIPLRDDETIGNQPYLVSVPKTPEIDKGDILNHVLREITGKYRDRFGFRTAEITLVAGGLICLIQLRRQHLPSVKWGIFHHM